jgi:hypothetical protein
MKSILSLGIALITATKASAETTVAVLEFGPGGSVRRTSSIDESTPAAAASFFAAMHRPSKAHIQQAGMLLVPDIFNRADAGIVIGLSGAGVSSMSSAMDLLTEGAADVVGTFVTTGTSADVMRRLSKKTESASEDFERHLGSTVEKASGEEMQVVSLTVNEESAADADTQLVRMLSSLKAQAKENDKTYVVHLVIDTPSNRRRLEDVQAAQEDAVNQEASSSTYYYGQKTMYEIQNFNVIAWTSVGLVVLVMFVMSHFIAMPLMPDTLLHGEAAKFGTD